MGNTNRNEEECNKFFKEYYEKGREIIEKYGSVNEFISKTKREEKPEMTIEYIEKMTEEIETKIQNKKIMEYDRR